MELIEKIEVPGYSGGCLRIQAKSTIRITDVEGRQVGDLFAFPQDDPTEYLCTARTREITERLFPAVGQQFCTNYYRPILTFISDHSLGIHDSLYAACDPALYQLHKATEGHPSCHENFLKAATKLGIDVGFVPGPVNLFQNSPVENNEKLYLGPALTHPGDYVELRAELDLSLILTSCSYDLDSQFIGDTSTPLLIEVFH